MGGVLQLWVAKIGSQLELGGCVNGGGEEGSRVREERECIVGEGGSQQHVKEEGGVARNVQNNPLSLYFCVSGLFIFNAASLVRNPNSKPKSII